ncbi:MAG TPA: hypothetical protein VGM94_02370 [Galbitalea sp.]
MAAVSMSRRSTAGIIFIVAGVLLALAVLLPLVGVAVGGWLVAIAYLAITAAFAVLGIGAVNATLTKVLLIAAAVGWLLLALAAFGLALPSVLITIAALVAGVAGLIGAIVLYVGKEVRNLPAVIFIITTALGLLFLLPSIGVSIASLATIIAVLFAAGLIVTGVLFAQKERGRR